MSWSLLDDEPPNWVEVGNIRGPAGPPGPQGPPGGGVFVHTQSSPAATWTIPHGLGRIPHSVVIYIDGEQVLTDIEVDATNVVVSFPSPETGEAHIL